MSEENITQDALSGESQLNSSDADGTVSSETPMVPLAQLNEILGKQYKDTETAIKSIKDTFGYVGAKVDKVEDELKSKGFISKRELDELLFYRDNPDYGQYRDVIDAYAQRSGVSPAEAVKSDVLSGLISKARTADSYTETQSVIESNPRLVASRDSLSQARDIMKTRGRNEQVESLVAKAVMDAYE